MKLIAALSTLGMVASAAASGNGHHSLRHDRSLQVIACPDDVKECEDGSFVDRDADMGCEFRPCPDEIACAANVQECPDGSYVSRDPANNCAFRPCPDEIACAADVQECADGSFVSRDPGNNCEFKPCPEAPATCLVNGIKIDAGEKYIASDGCNTW
jgi:hypothetical protein